MRKVMMASAMVLAGCSGRGEIIPTPSPAPEAPTTAERLNAEALGVNPTTTTEPAPEPTTAPEPEPTPTPPRPAPTYPMPPLPDTSQYLQPVATTQARTGNCGGTLPPCYVMERESGGSLTVYNYSGSGASGKWQVMPSTWRNYRGYANAADAPEAVQDAFARQLWANGAGCQHWNAC